MVTLIQNLNTRCHVMVSLIQNIDTQQKHDMVRLLHYINIRLEYKDTNITQKYKHEFKSHDKVKIVCITDDRVRLSNLKKDCDR